MKQKLTHEQIREKINKSNVTNCIELFCFLYDLNKEFEFNQGEEFDKFEKELKL
jgi:hypothetical protein